MRRLTILTMALALAALAGCRQTAEDRYQNYLDEVSDSTSTIEFITPEEDPVAPPTDDGDDPFADDEGIYTIPDIPQQRDVDPSANSYELEKVMMGKE